MGEDALRELQTPRTRAPGYLTAAAWLPHLCRKLTLGCIQVKWDKVCAGKCLGHLHGLLNATVPLVGQFSAFNCTVLVCLIA